MQIHNGYWLTACCCVPVCWGIWKCLKKKVVKTPPPSPEIQRVDQAAKIIMLAPAKKEEEEIKASDFPSKQDPKEIPSLSIGDLWNRLQQMPITAPLKKLELGDKTIHAHLLKLEGCPVEFMASVAPSSWFSPDTFWTAMAHYHFSTIIDLTRPEDLENQEGDEEEDAPILYYPIGDLSTQSFKPKLTRFGNVEVTQKKPISIKSCGFWELRYQITLDGGPIKEEITRLHFPVWEDGTAISLKELSRLVKHLESRKEKRFWVHCRAGYGRTGTLVTAFFLKSFIKSGKIHLKNLSHELVQLIHALRQMRGRGFVWTEAQFSLLHAYGLKLLTRG